MKRFLFLFPLLLCLACTHKPAKMIEGPREFMFPYGNYQHDVRVHLTKAPPRGPQDFAFRGVFDFRKDHLNLVALSPFGTTMFRVQENLQTHQIQMEIFVDALKKYEDRIRPLYEVTRDILTLPLQDFEKKGIQVLTRNEKNRPLKMMVPTGQTTVAVDISQYDELEIPKVLKVQAQEFQLDVKVVDYEL
jgi:hypothetical protein